MAGHVKINCGRALRRAELSCGGDSLPPPPWRTFSWGRHILYYSFRAKMISRRVVLITVGALLYSALALALVEASAIERIGKLLPDPLLPIVVIIVVTALGPVAFFAEGSDAWPVIAIVLALITICLGLARLTWRRFPETEWFAFWLLCAVLVWAGSPWLLVLLLI